MLLVLAGILTLGLLCWNYAGRAALQRVTHQGMGCNQNLGTLQSSLNLYAEKHNGLFPDKLGSLVPDYLVQLPNCPNAKADTYSVAYVPSTDHSKFELSCELLKENALIGINPGYFVATENYSNSLRTTSIGYTSLERFFLTLKQFRWLF
ncbi:hypothetical protein JST97_35680 [bacterium]|nr:hypothetical protein [bacterium]